MSDEKSWLKSPWFIAIGSGVVLIAIERTLDWAEKNVDQNDIAQGINSVAEPVLTWLTNSVSVPRWAFAALVAATLIVIAFSYLTIVGFKKLEKRIGNDRVKAIGVEILKGYARMFNPFGAIDLDKIERLLRGEEDIGGVGSAADEHASEFGLDELDEETLDIIRFLTYMQHLDQSASLQNIRAAIELDVLRTEQRMDNLEGLGFVYHSLVIGEGKYYRLSPEGRDFAIAHDLVADDPNQGRL